MSHAGARWLLPGGILLLAITVVLSAYYPTIFSAVQLWATHKTYGYAFVVLPIVVFLVWRDRALFANAAPRPSIHGAAIAVAFSALWLAGARLHILEMQHLALPGMLVGLIVSAIGWSNAARVWLPLAYLFLLAPAGTPLLPYLQDVATFLATVFLQMGQIPFYAEGYTIEVATGKYVIAPGCAGLNFILALATVAPLFCVLMYNTWSKRIAVLAVMMIVVPIANGFRVFAIIAIAEYTNRAIDIAADHLLYGWLFFSLIVLVMFWIGSFFADPIAPLPLPTAAQGSGIERSNINDRSVLGRLIFVLAAVTVICIVPALLV